MLLSIGLAVALAQSPGATALVKTDAGWELQRDGKPYFIKGAGASVDLLPQLKAAGANSIRTWGVGDDTQALLDKAQELGLTVTVGIWLRKVDDGFSYDKLEDRQSQYRQAAEAVLKYKDHPAVLMWAVGNEMELGAPDERVWSDVEACAKIFKRNDPSRPVMTVVADMWPDKMAAILKHCPSIDILGVNSYDGLPTLESRMKDWTKPYIITEFAFSGGNEKTPFGLSKELDTTRKAESTKENYENRVTSLTGRVLGSYFFHWSKSSTQTASLHSSFLRTGEKLQVVDELTRLWGGPEPENRAPLLIKAEALDEFKTAWRVEYADPDNDDLDYQLEVISEDPAKRFVGDFEKEQPVVYSQPSGPRFSLPAGLKSGKYRAYLIVRDGKGGAAVWNHPFEKL